MTNRQVSKPLIALIAVAVGIGANLILGYSTSSVGFLRVSVWIISIVCILVLVGTMERAINGRWDGVVIDARNKVSLSKLQATAWSVLVASSIATYAATRAALSGGGISALDFSIPNELLIAMGISATSLIASPAVLSLKTGSGDALPWDAPSDAKIDRADGKVLAEALLRMQAGSIFSRATRLEMRMRPTFPGSAIPNNARAHSCIRHNDCKRIV